MIVTQDSLGAFVRTGDGLSSRFALYGTDNTRTSIPLPEWFRMMERVQKIYLGLSSVREPTAEAQVIMAKIERLVGDVKRNAWIDADGVTVDQSSLNQLVDMITQGHTEAKSAEGREFFQAQRALDAVDEKMYKTIDIATAKTAPTPSVPYGTMSSREAARQAVQLSLNKGRLQKPVLPTSSPLAAKLTSVPHELPEAAPIVAGPKKGLPWWAYAAPLLLLI